MTTVRGDRATTWKRSRLLTGGAIVLIGALWTGPQMAAAAPTKDRLGPEMPGKEKAKPSRPSTTTTTTADAPPTTTTTTTKPPATTTTTVKKPPATTTTTVRKPPATTTTTVKKSDPPPSDGGPSGPPSNGPGNGNGNGGGNADGTAGGPAVAPTSGVSPPSIGTSDSGGTSSGRPPAPGGGRGARGPDVKGPAVSDVAVPAPDGDTAVNALRGPDAAAQATVRSISGGQSLPSQGGTAFYAQLASSPDALAVDDYPGNPYLVFVILVVFGIGVGLTGRRRHDGPLVAAAA